MDDIDVYTKLYVHARTGGKSNRKVLITEFVYNSMHLKKSFLVLPMATYHSILNFNDVELSTYIAVAHTSIMYVHTCVCMFM